MTPTPADYLSTHPSASLQEVMAACSCTARQARNAMAAREKQQLRRQQLRSLALKSSLPLLAFAALLTWAFWPSAPLPQPQTLSQEQIKRAEKGIYAALDAKDPSKAAEVAGYLQSEEESLRLAALRYLSTVVPDDSVDKLIPLVDDKSSRVRLAAIQLLQRVGGERVQATLLQVASDTQREAAERNVAVAALSKRGADDKLALARQLLPLLLDERAAVSQGVDQALRRLTGKQVAPSPDAKRVHQAWQEVLS